MPDDLGTIHGNDPHTTGGVVVVFIAELVGEGFVEITPEKVAVLTDMAVKESDIDESAAEEAIRRAEQAMSGEKLTNEEYAANNAALLRSLALVKVKRRRHHG